MSAFLHVADPGLAASFQDCGREGYQRFGVPVSGALDAVSLQIANAVAGNAPGEAAIEVLGAGLALRVCADSVTIATAGAAASFVIETGQASERVPAFQSATARRGDLLRFPPPKESAVFYIAAAGGFDLPSVLGSASTTRRANLGGHRGRALAAGDDLPLRRQCASERGAVWLDASIPAPKVLRVVRGPNLDFFTPRAFETLFASAYTVAPDSDRMGLRLHGQPLERAIGGELTSQGTTAGAMQVPADGQPILLLADRQTTGGYPRIATVTGADIAAAGRLAAGMSVRFEEVSREDAIAALKARREWLASLPSLLTPAEGALSAERLLGANLIGGVTSGAPEDG
ncbi:MAG: biotin-dependent carboxyltransferase family protein [Rhodomicrobium sp.]